MIDMFLPQSCFSCGHKNPGAHYSHFKITGGVLALREFFPNGTADEMNFCLFSTSGVHGSYLCIEEIEESLRKYGVLPPCPEDQDHPDDYLGTELTVLIVQPRICCLRYGNIHVTLEDMSFLKRLRESSWAAVRSIGVGNEKR